MSQNSLVSVLLIIDSELSWRMIGLKLNVPCHCVKRRCVTIL